MNNIYHWIGLIVFWGGLALSLYLFLDYAYYKWFKESRLRLLLHYVKHSMWVFQLYERMRFEKQFQKIKTTNYRDVNWYVVENISNEFEGKSKNKYAGRKNNIFIKYYKKRLKEMFATDHYKTYLAHKQKTEEAYPENK
jgi:hypothetical protein